MNDIIWFGYTYLITIIYKAKIVPFLEQGLMCKIRLKDVSLCYVLISGQFEEKNLIVLLE